MGLVFCDHFVKVARRLGMLTASYSCIVFQRLEESLSWVEGDVETRGRTLEVAGWREERSPARVSHKFSATLSASLMSLETTFDPVTEVSMEFVAMRAFWSLMRVLSRESKVERWCLIARPFVTSTCTALERDAATVFCSSAIILRRAARSFAFGSVGPSLMLVSSLSPSAALSSSSISTLSESPSSSSTAMLSGPSIPSSMSSSSEFPSFRPSASSGDFFASPLALDALLSLNVNFANLSSSPLSNASSLSISSSASDCCWSRSSSGSAYSALPDSSCSLWLPKGSSSLSSSRSTPLLMLAPSY